jgi:hypothetical protein
MEAADSAQTASALLRYFSPWRPYFSKETRLI